MNIPPRWSLCTVILWPASNVGTISPSVNWLDDILPATTWYVNTSSNAVVLDKR